MSTEFEHYVYDQVTFDKHWEENKTEEWLVSDENPLEQSPYTLQLHRIPGIKRGNPISFHLPPIAASLRHNTYFRALRLCNVPNLKDVILLIANILRHNQNLSCVELLNLGSSKYFLALGDMLRDNINHVVQYLSLAGSKITNTGMMALSIALEKFRHILKGLNLSNCGITGKRAEMLVNAFKRNYAMSISIEELNLSNNKFDTESSKVLEEWLFESKEYSHLKKLEVRQSNINMTLFARSFRSLKYLKHLDISDNKLEQGAVELLCVAIEESHTLQHLDFSNCSLKAIFISKIATAILSNRSLSNVYLDLSYNQCSGKSAEILAESFKKGQNLHTFHFSGYKWKPEALVLFLKAIARKKCLDTLVLNDSCRKTTAESASILARAIYITLKHTPSLKALSLCGGYDKVIPPLLEHLAKIQTLLELSIESNQLGDRGAYLLSEMLRNNNTLKLLCCDRNGIGLNGWKSIRLSFEVNTTLIHLPYPWNDLKKISSSGSNSLQNRTKDVLRRLQHHINTNTNLEPRKFVFLDSDPIYIPPIETEPLPNIPEYLMMLQKQAQSQFEEKKLYWMVNDPGDISTVSTIEGDDDEDEWDDPFLNESTIDLSKPPSSPIPPPPLSHSSSLLQSLMGESIPQRPMPSPHLQKK